MYCRLGSVCRSKWDIALILHTNTQFTLSLHHRPLHPTGGPTAQASPLKKRVTAAPESLCSESCDGAANSAGALLPLVAGVIVMGPKPRLPLVGGSEATALGREAPPTNSSLYLPLAAGAICAPLARFLRAMHRSQHQWELLKSDCRCHPLHPGYRAGTPALRPAASR